MATKQQNSPFLGKVHPRVQLCRHREVLRLSIQDKRYEQNTKEGIRDRNMNDRWEQYHEDEEETEGPGV